MYKVIQMFTDLQDKEYRYEIGDVYPREGLEVTKERFEELAGKENKRGEQLIEFVDDAEKEAEGQGEQKEPAKPKGKAKAATKAKAEEKPAAE